MTIRLIELEQVECPGHVETAETAGGRVGAHGTINGLFKATEAIDEVFSADDIFALLDAAQTTGTSGNDASTLTNYPLPATPASVRNDVLADADAALDLVMAELDAVALDNDDAIHAIQSINAEVQDGVAVSRAASTLDADKAIQEINEAVSGNKTAFQNEMNRRIEKLVDKVHSVQTAAVVALKTSAADRETQLADANKGQQELLNQIVQKVEIWVHADKLMVNAREHVVDHGERLAAAHRDVFVQKRVAERNRQAKKLRQQSSRLNLINQALSSVLLNPRQVLGLFIISPPLDMVVGPDVNNSSEGEKEVGWWLVEGGSLIEPWGTMRDISEIWTGVDAHGEELDTTDRVITGGGALIPFLPGSWLRGLGRVGKKGAGKAADWFKGLVRQGDKLDDIKDQGGNIKKLLKEAGDQGDDARRALDQNPGQFNNRPDGEIPKPDIGKEVADAKKAVAPPGAGVGPDDAIPDGFSFDIDNPMYRRLKSGDQILEYSIENGVLNVDWIDGAGGAAMLKRVLDVEGANLQKISGYATDKLGLVSDEALLRFGRQGVRQLGGDWVVSIRKEGSKRFLEFTK